MARGIAMPLVIHSWNLAESNGNLSDLHEDLRYNGVKFNRKVVSD